jgi:hypothetical protein
MVLVSANPLLPRPSGSPLNRLFADFAAKRELLPKLFCSFRPMGAKFISRSRFVPHTWFERLPHYQDVWAIDDPRRIPVGLASQRFIQKLDARSLQRERPKTHRYRLTDLGLRTAWFFTRTYSRILRPGIGRILPELSTPNGSLRRCFDKLDQEVKAWVGEAKLAA